MRRNFFILFLAVLTLILVSCDPPDDLIAEKYPSVDPLFREYYDQIGGLDILGPAISDRFEYEGLDCQFTTAALMVHDQQSTERQPFRLAPIGLQMNILEPPIAQPDRQDLKYVDGHVVYEKFVPLYEQMGGGLFVGKPLTELHYNPMKQRYEQYFENVGFYTMERDATGTAHLLSYGAWFCPHDCRKIPPGDNSMVFLPYHTSLEFIDAVSRLGPTFTGFAISEEYTTPDGYMEQVFENIVLVSDPNQPGGVMLRSVPERLGYLPEPPVDPKDIPGMIFYPTQADGKGYPVSGLFMDYIAQHGGQELFGQPIDQRRLIKDNVYRQCFQTVCLEEHPDEYEYMRIRPSPLGYTYKEMAVLPVYSLRTSQEIAPEQIYLQPTGEAQESITSYMPASPTQEQTSHSETAQISIQVWESFQMLSPGGYQEVGVSVYEDNFPLKGIEPDIYVTMPDGSTRTYYMYPTGEDGQSRLVLEPIDAPHGTLIPYEVCVFMLGGQKLCVKESFLIW
jgi:hypothetical protein